MTRIMNIFVFENFLRAENLSNDLHITVSLELIILDTTYKSELYV